MPNKRKNKGGVKQAVGPVVLPQGGSRFTVAIVGGGASGIAAACALGACARTAHIDVRVVLLEQGRRLGSSILRSGNGRCNFSHLGITSQSFNHPEFVEQALEALERAFQTSPLAALDDALGSRIGDENAVLRWFSDLGLVWREAPLSAGALYPFSNKATSVLEVLQVELDRCGVERYCGVSASAIMRCDDRFELQLHAAFGEDDRTRFPADVVIYAGGGDMRSSFEGAGVFKTLTTIPSVSVLGPLRTNTELLSRLDGMRVRVRLSCDAKHFSEEGEVLFRSYGVSGIVVFNASRFVEPGDTISLDLVPERSLERLQDLLQQRARFQAQKRGHVPTYAELLQGFVLPDLAQALIRFSAQDPLVSGVSDDAAVDDPGIARLAKALKAFELVVLDRGAADQCQVRRGGVRLDQIDATTMQACKVPGLFVTGEALDVDGACGGYNLHWAWASGLLAGLSIAREVAGGSVAPSSGALEPGA